MIGSRYDNINTAIPECGLVKSILELIKYIAFLTPWPLSQETTEGVRKSFK